MLVTFRSTAAGSVTMFGDVAITLLKMMGSTGRVPSALRSEDVPAALERLRAALEDLRKRGGHMPAPAAMNEDWGSDDQKDQKGREDEDREPPVSLTMRATPLIELLERAARAKAEVMWDKT